VKNNKPRRSNMQMPGPKGAHGVLKQLHPARVAAENINNSTGRFAAYPFLKAVYRTVQRWKRQRQSRRMARRLGRQLNIPSRKRTSPFRIVIDATATNTNPKERSRWTRALEYAASKNASATDLEEFIRSRNGISGCARLAAKHDPRQNRARDDWSD
jgi:hypothetical protein